MQIKEVLSEEILEQLNTLKGVEMGSEMYKVSVEGIAKLIDKSNDIKKIEQEAEEAMESRKIDTELRLKQMKDENKDRLIKNGIAIGGIVLPLLVTIWGTKVSFKFEEKGTITTAMGRGFINKLLPKK